MINPNKKAWVSVLSGLQPCEKRAVWISEGVWICKEPFFWSKPAPSAGYPDLLLPLTTLDFSSMIWYMVAHETDRVEMESIVVRYWILI
jgi:hypothetical protein